MISYGLVCGYMMCLIYVDIHVHVHVRVYVLKCMCYGLNSLLECVVDVLYGPLFCELM